MFQTTDTTPQIRKPPRRRRKLKTSVMLLGLVGITTCIHLLFSLRYTSNLSMVPSLTYDQQQQQQHPLSLKSLDPTKFHNNPLPFTYQLLPSNHTKKSICDVPPGTGEEGPAGIKGLYKIQQAMKMTTKYNNQQQLQSVVDNNNKMKLFCMVYTYEQRHDIVKIILETYVQYCDGFVAFSNVTDIAYNIISIPHDGSEEYGNMWSKVRSMWQFVYNSGYVNEYDLFHIGGDDMYVIPQHIKQMILDEKKMEKDVLHNQPLYMGASIPNPQNPKRRFAGGGAGYTLNSVAVKVLVNKLFHHEDCRPAIASNEDIRIGKCFDIIGIKCMDTNDHTSPELEVRYHHLDVHYHTAWIPTRSSLWHWEKLHYFHNIRGNQTQLHQISNTSISFHLDKGTIRSNSRDRGLRRYHAILYNMCGTQFQQAVEKAATCTKEERLLLRQQWELIPKASSSSQ